MTGEMFSESGTIVQPRRRNQGDDNLIPLINIVFLLLVFFMVAGQLRPAAPTEVELARVATNAAPAASHQTRVAIHLNAQGQIWVDGKPVADEQLRAALASLEVGQQVKLYADRAVTAAALSTVLSSLPAQNLTLHLLTEADSTSSDTAQQ